MEKYMSDIRKYINLLEQYEGEVIMENKIPEYVLDKLDLKFSANRGKFKSASEKFIAVRDALIRQTLDPETKAKLQIVTPGTFFRFKKGNRDMIAPEEPINTPRPVPSKPVERNDIPFTVDTSGVFEALPHNIHSKHTMQEILSYYMNTYANSIPTSEIARNVAFNHFQYDDKVKVGDVEKMLNNAKLDPSVKRRLPDDMIISKSIEHFGFKSDDEIRQAIKDDYDGVKSEYDQQRKDRMKVSAPLPYTPKEYDKEKEWNHFHRTKIDGIKHELILAYLKRDAKKLNHQTKKLQMITFIKDKKMIK